MFSLEEREPFIRFHFPPTTSAGASSALLRPPPVRSRHPNQPPHLFRLLENFHNLNNLLSRPTFFLSPTSSTALIPSSPFLSSSTPVLTTPSGFALLDVCGPAADEGARVGAEAVEDDDSGDEEDEGEEEGEEDCEGFRGRHFLLFVGFLGV